MLMSKIGLFFENVEDKQKKTHIIVNTIHSFATLRI